MISRVWFSGGLFGLVLGLFVISLPQSSIPLSAQPAKKKMREEEEEEPQKTKVPKKLDEIDPKGQEPAPAIRQPPPPGTFNIAEEAPKAQNPFVKDMLRRLAVPYDLLTSAGGATYKIACLPERKLPDAKFTYLELNASLTGGKEKVLATGAGFSLKPYEEIVLEDVENLLKRKLEGIKRDDVLELCVQVLQAVRRKHALAIEQRKRIGKDWEPVDDKLRKRIVQLRRDQLKAYVAAKEWKKADDLTLELSNYSDDPEAQKDIYRLLLLKAIESLNPDRDEDFINLRDAVNQFENIAGGKGEAMANTARQKLTNRAKQIVDQAKKQADMNMTANAFNLLKSADALDPDLPAIQELRSRLRDRILYVGVPSLPFKMSPALARSDSERWAMELLFESLLESVPDAELGRRYRPLLAAGMPALVPMGREFALRNNVRWAGDNGKTLDARDVFGTIELLRKISNSAAADGIDMLDADRVRIEDPYKLRLSFKQGLLEPLNRATFKVLPARYLKAQGKEADDDAFGRNPFGSGPFRYEGREQESADREAVVFRANPYYSQRSGKFGLPNIREIRFVKPNLSTVGADLANGQLHLVLDVPTGDIPRYRDDPLSAGLVTLHEPKQNRRIYTLAINHRRLALQNPDIRRGISAAIDREAIIDTVYRAKPGKLYHRPLTGPFPLDCWATPVKARRSEAALYNQALAGALLSAAAGRDRLKLSLKYPEDDPLALRACGRIKDQIEMATKKTPDDTPAVAITLEGVPANVLPWKLEQEHDFELAYVPYDYPDDLYWLGSLLDRSAAKTGGRNYLGYLSEGTNPQPDDNDLRITLDEIRSCRNFRDKVREETWKVHAKFLNRMPFVPLWQLDRHFIVHKGVEMHLDNPGEKLSPERLDPSKVFTGIEGWKLR